MERITALQDWLATIVDGPYTLSAPIGDASSRRYFRLTLADGTHRIAMDAPPASNDLAPFIKVAGLFGQAVRVPRILAEQREQGFLLLDDLGTQDLCSATQAAADGAAANIAGRVDGAAIEAARQHYLAVCDSLVALQAASQPEALPRYDAATMADDLDRFAQWYADQHLGKPLQGADLALWERMRALLVLRAQAQGQVWIHFDFHSRNLIAGTPPGVLDFQDARLGPISYDLVSLLKDVYINWPEDFRLDVAIRYWQKARKASLPVPDSFDDFYADFEWMGVFRHLRTLGTFARLAHRDGKTHYVDDMPAALAYLRETCARYNELHPLYKLLERLTGTQTQVGYTF
jgi:aminoglycoside/choline kinase family phosphotransferase